jgi:hypothetical protein
MSFVEATYLAWIDVRELGLATPPRISKRMASGLVGRRRLRRSRLAAPQFRLPAQHPGRSIEAFRQGLSDPA